MKRRDQAGPPRPTEGERTRGRRVLWGEAVDDAGQRVVSYLRGPVATPSRLRPVTYLAVVSRVVGGEAPPGFPDTVHRLRPADLVLGLEGVTRTDE